MSLAHFEPGISSTFTCRCKKLSPARKQMSVYRAPNVLVIQMKVILETLMKNSYEGMKCIQRL